MSTYMYKNTKSQKGFTLVEGMLLAILLVVVGTAGYLVFSKQDKKSDNTTTTPNTTQSSNSTESNTSTAAKPTQDTTPKTLAGYKSYSNDKVALQHPETWVVSTDSAKPEWTYIKSVDYQPIQIGGQSITGYYLEIRVSKSESYESYAEDLKNAPTAKENFGGSYETIKIDGNDSILSNTKTEGSFWYARAFKNGNTYLFRLNAADEKKPEVKELFKTILSTVDIK